MVVRGVGFSLVGCDPREDAVTVGALGFGGAFGVMDGAGQDVVAEFLGQRDELQDSIGRLGAYGIGCTVCRVDLCGEDVECVDEVMC